MIRDKRQALEDLLAGWTEYVRDGRSKGYENAYPVEYVTFLEHLYCEVADTLTAGTSPADFVRDTLLPLFGGEPAPRAVYGWTENDVLERWDELRSWGEVVDKEMPVDDALKLLEDALAVNLTYIAGDEAINEAIRSYVAENSLGVEQT